MSRASIDHVSVKLFARQPVNVQWANLIPLYHRWIQQGVFPEALLIDVADYSHVPSGPGVMLIGHHAHISIDNRENRPGLLYTRRTAMDGTFADKLRYAYDRAIAAARRLEREPEFLGAISFDETDIEISINDRILAANTQETWNSLRGDIVSVFGAGASLEWNGPGRELFRVAVKAAASARI
jgi:hypothetical protein